jgi:outer membrane biosynthesis protein TonB
LSSSTQASWLDEQEALQRRNWRRGVLLSVVLHGCVAAGLLYAPEPEPMRLPEVISVKMVSLPGAPPAPPKAAPRKAVPKPTPAPAPTPARTPAPAPKKVLLPKRPQKVSKKRKPKPKPLEYDDALAALRDELGEPDPPVASEEEVSDADLLATAEPAVSPGAGVEVDPALAKWLLDTRRHLRQVWVVPPDFLEQGLVTGLIVTLSASGDVLGQPEITRTSGNPYFDENTVRALVRASPLPPPPESGDWPFQFSADEGP